jgi:curved DNA-binding protein CbpA
MPDLYEVLQVHRRAEPEVIRAAYRALSRKYHPDFGGAPDRMVALNEAWGVLGDHLRRAAYDASPEAHGIPKREREPVSTGPDAGHLRPNSIHLRPREPRREDGSGTVLDFGRYAGWSVGRLADHDPNYLEWLARTSIGRRLTAEIEALLADRAVAAAAATRPTVGVGRRSRR